MDQELNRLIRKETKRQNIGVELIASENYASKDVRKACSSILTNKYVVSVEQLRLLGAAAVPAVVLGAIRPVHLRDAGDGELFRVRREQRGRKKEKKRK